ncbi:MAG: tRNA pseudouridine(55) synthase TruB [Myxococcota bacterium]|mgnify:CR=1 FL=1
MHGVLIVDKPAGPTSHDVVVAMRKALREKKVGHTGTLDPVATGVLPLVLGDGTKIARYLTGHDKTYRATVCLGITTDTHDTAGRVVAEHPVEVSETAVREALASFRGEIEQVPPMYSAKKVQGQKLYELARQGVEIERESKRVTIHTLEVIEVALPDVTLELRCSAGTYVRVLAYDLGQKLACGAHLKELRRLAVGSFTLADAVGLEAAIDDPELAKSRIISLDRALIGIPRIDLPSHVARLIASGYQLSVADLRTLDTPTFANDTVLTLGVDGGGVVAVARSLLASEELGRSRRDRQAVKTERVLAQPR